MRKLRPTVSLLQLPLLLLLSPILVNCAGETIDCKSVHDGTFIMPDPILGDTKIERMGGKQIEEAKDFKAMFDVEWKDECTYVLKNKVLLRGDERFTPVKDAKMTIEINKIDNDSVYFTVSSNRYSGTMDGSMKIID